jgi:hypothetical protein
LDLRNPASNTNVERIQRGRATKTETDQLLLLLLFAFSVLVLLFAVCCFGKDAAGV